MPIHTLKEKMVRGAFNIWKGMSICGITVVSKTDIPNGKFVPNGESGTGLCPNCFRQSTKPTQENPVFISGLEEQNHLSQQVVDEKGQVWNLRIEVPTGSVIEDPRANALRIKKTIVDDPCSTTTPTDDNGLGKIIIENE